MPSMAAWHLGIWAWLLLKVGRDTAGCVSVPAHWYYCVHDLAGRESEW